MVTSLQPGVWGVLATPFTGSVLDLDESGLARLCEHYQSIGVTGLTALGVFGEAARLTEQERATVLEIVTDTCELPIVVGATSLSTRVVIDEVNQAVEIVGDRIAAVMVQVNTAAPSALTDHLAAVHDATGLGIVVQDYPAVSGVSIRPESLVAALRGQPFCAAVKAESPPTAVAIHALAAGLQVPVFGGLGGIGLLDELAAGAAGAMTGFSAPEGLLACVRAWEQGGYEAAREAWLPYLPLATFEQQVGIALGIRKEALRMRGLIAESGVRLPGRGMPDELSEQLGRHLDAAKSAAAATL
ncbi:dihydrodipicolinate synthase family protein [Nakamurella lactea]|uniref:dihydrodipicolinate synthase family protein n=1 Tax=Nakamurella lactea TaxID=459515 RepID=UPI000404F932|nr:dihydrodipicolinate synthase family protein [Nakamurella lactea]